MPIYQFYCKKCKTHIDRLTSYENRESQVCETCKSKLEFQISAPGTFILMGDGFYKPSTPDSTDD